MNRQALADELDQQVERLFEARDVPAPNREWDSLLSIADDLRQMPRLAFRSQLGADLMAKAETDSTTPCLENAYGGAAYAQGVHSDCGHSFDQLVGSTALAETLPTFAGKDFRLFPVDHRSFVFSFLSHTVLIALIASTIWMAKVPIKKTIKAVSAVTYLSVDHGGGGSGRHNSIPVSRGTPPKFSDQQLSPPIIVESHPSRLPVPPAVIGPPDVRLPESNQLGDLMASAGALPSNGSGSGGARGNGSGTGLGSGIGPGVGPGRDGGFGGGAFSNPSKVIAPRAIYSPDPEYSEEGRKTKQQGTVVLSLMVDPDGRPRDIHVVRSLGMGLDEKAAEALRKWRFEPGRKGGVRVAMQVSVEVNFRLY